MRSKHQLYKYFLKSVLHPPSGNKVLSCNWLLSVQPAWGDQREKASAIFFYRILIFMSLMILSHGSPAGSPPVHPAYIARVILIKWQNSDHVIFLLSALQRLAFPPRTKLKILALAAKASCPLHALLCVFVPLARPFSAPARASLQVHRFVKPAPPQSLCTYCLLCLECHPHSYPHPQKSSGLPQLLQSLLRCHFFHEASPGGPLYMCPPASQQPLPSSLIWQRISFLLSTCLTEDVFFLFIFLLFVSCQCKSRNFYLACLLLSP